jgi:hypothetical protein
MFLRALEREAVATKKKRKKKAPWTADLAEPQAPYFAP